MLGSKSSATVSEPATNGLPFLPAELENKTKNLILLLENSGTKRWKRTKTDYLRKLEGDNKELKNMLTMLQRQINGYEAQNEILKDQLKYFQSTLAQITQHN